MKWLKVLGLVLQAVTAALRVVGGWRQRRLGRLENENARLRQDHETLRKAAAARRGVRHDADSVRRDPRNRDAG